MTDDDTAEPPGTFPTPCTRPGAYNDTGRAAPRPEWRPAHPIGTTRMVNGRGREVYLGRTATGGHAWTPVRIQSPADRIARPAPVRSRTGARPHRAAPLRIPGRLGLWNQRRSDRA